MIVVTGGAGFIGSAFVWKLNQEGIDDILVVDRLGAAEKWKNLVALRYAEYRHKDEFLPLLRDERLPGPIEGIVHLGACSSTTERDADYLMANNYRYTRDLAQWAVAHGVRFVYASSAATYGDGSRGFQDDASQLAALQPLNMYGYSKHVFDQHALRAGWLATIAGVKFFNVFGPNEYHKGAMTSVVHNAFGQIQESGRVQLFRSYRDEYPDGGQRRDFVYVKDCVDTLWWLLRNPSAAGLFNLGTGRSRSWNDLAHAVFAALGREPQIEYVEMPAALQGKYQYFTEASMHRLRAAGCPTIFRTLEESVRDYVQGYLLQGYARLSLTRPAL